jgi:hypothetical protein
MDAERMGFGRFVWKIFYVSKVDIDGSLMCMFALGEVMVIQNVYAGCISAIKVCLG